MAAPRALIVTGERESGKTTLCLALAASSPRFVGIVSVPLLDAGGARIGFAARNLATGRGVGARQGGSRPGRTPVRQVQLLKRRDRARR